jgi:hypothetical protein
MIIVNWKSVKLWAFRQQYSYDPHKTAQFKIEWNVLALGISFLLSDNLYAWSPQKTCPLSQWSIIDNPNRQISHFNRKSAISGQQSEKLKLFDDKQTIQKFFIYRGSPTSTVSTSTVSTSTNFSAIGIKFVLVGLLCIKIRTSGNWLCSTK